MRPKLHVTEISPVSALLKRIGKLHDRGQLVRTGEQPAGSCPLCTVHVKNTVVDRFLNFQVGGVCFPPWIVVLAAQPCHTLASYFGQFIQMFSVKVQHT